MASATRSLTRWLHWWPVMSKPVRDIRVIHALERWRVYKDQQPLIDLVNEGCPLLLEYEETRQILAQALGDMKPGRGRKRTDEQDKHDRVRLYALGMFCGHGGLKLTDLKASYFDGLPDDAKAVYEKAGDRLARSPFTLFDDLKHATESTPLVIGYQMGVAADSEDEIRQFIADSLASNLK